MFLLKWSKQLLHHFNVSGPKGGFGLPSRQSLPLMKGNRHQVATYPKLIVDEDKSHHCTTLMQVGQPRGDPTISRHPLFVLIRDSLHQVADYPQTSLSNEDNPHHCTTFSEWAN
jgi:hypothetical protein